LQQHPWPVGYKPHIPTFDWKPTPKSS
jgi:hypothetical protein